MKCVPSVTLSWSRRSAPEVPPLTPRQPLTDTTANYIFSTILSPSTPISTATYYLDEILIFSASLADKHTLEAFLHDFSLAIGHVLSSKITYIPSIMDFTIEYLGTNSFYEYISQVGAFIILQMFYSTHFETRVVDVGSCY